MTTLTKELDDILDRAVLHLRPTSAWPLSNAQKQANKKYLIEKLWAYISPIFIEETTDKLSDSLE
jgi:hypothetical protein